MDIYPFRYSAFKEALGLRLWEGSLLPLKNFAPNSFYTFCFVVKPSVKELFANPITSFLNQKNLGPLYSVLSWRAICQNSGSGQIYGFSQHVDMVDIVGIGLETITRPARPAQKKRKKVPSSPNPFCKQMKRQGTNVVTNDFFLELDLQGQKLTKHIPLLLWHVMTRLKYSSYCTYLVVNG